MIDYIPSNSVKKYIKDNNITFTDFEKAALIYNARSVTKEDVYAELAEEGGLFYENTIKRT